MSEDRVVRWRAFVLVDPTTGPTNHARGTAFAAGVAPPRGEAAALQAWAELAATEAEMWTGHAGVRSRIDRVRRAGAVPYVEALGWDDVAEREPHPANLVCSALASVVGVEIGGQARRVERSVYRCSGEVLDAAARAVPVRLPLDRVIVTVGTLVRSSRSTYHADGRAGGVVEAGGTLDDLMVLDDVEGVFARVRRVRPHAAIGESTGRRAAGQLAGGDPILGVVVTRARWDQVQLVPNGIVVGVWSVAGFTRVERSTQDDGRRVVQFMRAEDDAEVVALRRHLVGNRLVESDGSPFELRDEPRWHPDRLWTKTI